MDRGAELYRLFLSGDNDALVELIRDYKDGLIFYCNTILKDLSLSEELAEDTFVKLIVKTPRYSGKSSFKTFLYAIARNTVTDYLRKSARQRAVLLDDLSDFSTEESPESTYIKKEQLRTLHRSLQNLHTDYSQVLYLTYFENLSNKDVATVMKKSNRQIENLVYRAKKALKAELEREGFVYEGL